MSFEGFGLGVSGFGVQGFEVSDLASRGLGLGVLKFGLGVPGFGLGFGGLRVQGYGGWGQQQ